MQVKQKLCRVHLPETEDGNVWSASLLEALSPVPFGVGRVSFSSGEELQISTG